MIKFARKNIWAIPLFFLAYFIWRRLFIFANDVFLVSEPRMRYVLAIAAVSTAAAIIPVFSKIIDKYIIQSIKDEFEKCNKIAKPILTVASIPIGLRLAFFGLNADTGFLSGILAAGGASAFVFILLVYIVNRTPIAIKYTLGALRAFADMRFLASVLLLNAYAIFFLLTARQTFFWDNAGYWRTSAYLSEIAFSAPIQLLRSAIDSVFWHDYHFLPAIMPAYVMSIFNTGRMAFVLAIVNFYVVPFWALLYAASMKIAGFWGFAASAMALIFVPFLAVLGFLDVGGIIFAFAAAYLFFYSKDDGLISGLFLCVAMMYRRWFVFFVIAFLICAVLHALIHRQNLKKLTLMLFGFGAPMFLIFQGYISGILLRDSFAEIYAAYSFTINTDIRFILRYFGLILLSGASIYTFYAAYKKKIGFSAAFPLCCCILIFFLFTSIQSFGMQHLLLFAAPVALICINASQHKYKLAALAISALCVISVLIPRTQPQTIHEITGYALIPTFSLHPQIREDAEELSRLDNFVRNLDGGVSVLASSFVLNSDLLALVYPSFNPLSPLNANDSILHAAQVDRRDGLPFVLEFADYIVAAYPIQTHLDPDEQRSVAIPAYALLGDSPFSEAFKRLDISFELRDGIQVYVYKRIRESSAEELEWLWREITFGSDA